MKVISQPLLGVFQQVKHHFNGHGMHCDKSIFLHRNGRSCEASYKKWIVVIDRYMHTDRDARVCFIWVQTLRLQVRTQILKHGVLPQEQLRVSSNHDAASSAGKTQLFLRSADCSSIFSPNLDNAEKCP